MVFWSSMSRSKDKKVYSSKLGDTAACELGKYAITAFADCRTFFNYPDHFPYLFGFFVAFCVLSYFTPFCFWTVSWIIVYSGKYFSPRPATFLGTFYVFESRNLCVMFQTAKMMKFLHCINRFEYCCYLPTFGDISFYHFFWSLEKGN